VDKAYNKTIAINILSRIAKNKRIVLGTALTGILKHVYFLQSCDIEPVIEEA